MASSNEGRSGWHRRSGQECIRLVGRGRFKCKLTVLWFLTLSDISSSFFLSLLHAVNFLGHRLLLLSLPTLCSPFSTILIFNLHFLPGCVISFLTNLAHLQTVLKGFLPELTYQLGIVLTILQRYTKCFNFNFRMRKKLTQ